MTEGRREWLGELVAWHLWCLPARILPTKEMDLDDLNICKVGQEPSEAMKAYYAAEKARRLRRMGEGVQ